MINDGRRQYCSFSFTALLMVPPTTNFLDTGDGNVTVTNINEDEQSPNKRQRIEVIRVYSPYRPLGIGVLTYGRMGYCLPLLHLCHQHFSICPDVDVRTVTSHIRDSKLNANPRVTLVNMMTRLSTEERSRSRRY